MKKIIMNFIIYFLFIIGIYYIVSLHLKNKMDQILLKKNGEAVKFHGYYDTLVQWLKLIQNEKSIADYFNVDDSIAIYGMGHIGEMIYYELVTNKINVVCGIDKNNYGKNNKTGLEVYLIDDIKSLNIDYIIISISYLADEIVPMLENVKKVKIVTIDEIIQSVEKRS